MSNGIDAPGQAADHRHPVAPQHRGQLFDNYGNAGPTLWWDGRIVGGWYQNAVAAVIENEEFEEMPTAMELALREAMEGTGMEMPARSKKSKKRTKKKNRRREERDEIFSRTLQQHRHND